MNLQSIAGVAAGITGAFSLVGFVVYAIIHVTSKSIDRPYLTPEVIGALKNTGLDTVVAKEMSPKRVRDWLDSHNALTEKIIAELAAPEMKRRGSSIMYVSIGLLVLALVLGVAAMATQNPVTSPIPSPTDPSTQPGIEPSSEHPNSRERIRPGPGGDRITLELLMHTIADYERRLNVSQSECAQQIGARIKGEFDHALTLLSNKPAEWDAGIEKLSGLIDEGCADSEVISTAYLVRGMVFAFLGGRESLAENDFSSIIALSDAPEAIRAEAYYYRAAVREGSNWQRDAVLADYSEAIQSPSLPSELRAKALITRAHLLEPSIWLLFRMDEANWEETISDLSAVIEMSDAPVEQRVEALLDRGATYTHLVPAKYAEAIADYTAVIQTADAPAQERAVALFHRGLIHSKLDPPQTDLTLADFEAALKTDALPGTMRRTIRQALKTDRED